MGYTARIALLSAGLLALLLLAIGLAPRRELPAARAASGQPAPVASAPRCSDGDDTVTVIANTPQNNDVPLDAAISATFSCPADHDAIERAFVLYPPAKGSFEWRDRTLVFRPAEPLRPHTLYRVTLFAGLEDARGFVDGRKVSWPFWTR